MMGSLREGFTLMNLHLRLLRLRRSHRRLVVKVHKLEKVIAVYRRLSYDNEPTPLEEEAMRLAREELLIKLVDVEEDINIVESRILTVESEGKRKRMQRKERRYGRIKGKNVGQREDQGNESLQA